MHPNSTAIQLSSAGIHFAAADLDSARTTLEITIPPDLPLFAGHFPGQPILPGVVELDCVTSMAAICYPDLGDDQIAGLSAIKFKAPVAPGDRLRLTLERQDRTVDFVIQRQSTVCAQGRLHYQVGS